MYQHIGLLAGNSRNGGQQFDGFGDLLIETFGHHYLRLDVHLPTGQLRGQARVLAALADGQRGQKMGQGFIGLAPIQKGLTVDKQKIHDILFSTSWDGSRFPSGTPFQRRMA